MNGPPVCPGQKTENAPTWRPRSRFFQAYFSAFFDLFFLRFNTQATQMIELNYTNYTDTLLCRTTNQSYNSHPNIHSYSVLSLLV